jgi:hypothetical protein
MQAKQPNETELPLHAVEEFNIAMGEFTIQRRG